MNDPIPPAGSAQAAAAESAAAAAPEGMATGGPAPEGPAPEGTTVGATSAVTPPSSGIPATLQAAVVAVRSGARWFWWIAGLSAVNTVMHFTQADSQFVLGLGITAIADGAFPDQLAISLAIDALAIGYFGWIGLQAQRGKRWAFVAGLAVYVPDTLIYLAFQDWMPVAFHALAVYYIVRGWRALSALQPAPAPA